MAEYRCTNCGYVTDTDEAPEECPVCKHKESFEKIKDWYRFLQQSFQRCDLGTTYGKTRRRIGYGIGTIERSIRESIGTEYRTIIEKDRICVEGDIADHETRKKIDRLLAGWLLWGGSMWTWRSVWDGRCSEGVMAFMNTGADLTVISTSISEKLGIVPEKTKKRVGRHRIGMNCIHRSHRSR